MFITEEELLFEAKKVIGKTFYEIDQHSRLSSKNKNKGNLGQIIEESHFGYKLNSKSEADFSELGIELKVTPFKKNKKQTFSAKERLALNIINYMEEFQYEFNTSSFWRKNQKLLLMFYEWIPEIDRGDYRIVETILYKFLEEDLFVIKKDWEFIVQKIRNGEAHLLSEGDTHYLGACTKGANKGSLRQQPFSDIPAMQRAFSLKQSYMTALVREYITDEKLRNFASGQELQDKSIEQLLYEKFESYIGMTLEEMADKLDIEINLSNKASVANLISTLLGVKGTRLDKIAEFAKANIQFKTVRLELNGVPKEHMSFVNIQFKEVANEVWEESYIYDYFSQTQILFVVFQYDEDRKLIFRGVKLWHLTLEIIETKLKAFWMELHRILSEGVIFTETTRGISNNLPNAKFNGYFHVRPKGRNAADKVELPNGQWITKQCYWMDRQFVAEIVSDLAK